MRNNIYEEPLFSVRMKTYINIKVLPRRNIRTPIKVVMGRLQGDLTRKLGKMTGSYVKGEVREGLRMGLLDLNQPIQEHVRITTVKKKMEHGAREHG